MQDLNVAFIQDDISWQDPVANCARYSEYIKHLITEQSIDLIVLPEMFSTGFSMNPWEAFETMQSATVAWIIEQARTSGAVVSGSVVMQLEDECYINRMLWAKPDGELDWYDKKHLFRFGNEHLHFDAGNLRKVMQLKGWRILPLVCYDLRFPVWSRNRNDYDLALYVANWPDARQYAWDTLLKARAIENQCYIVGCNRLGADPLGNTFSGGSVILDCLGMPLVDGSDRAMVGSSLLSAEDLTSFRQKFPASLDADEFTLL